MLLAQNILDDREGNLPSKNRTKKTIEDSDQSVFLAMLNIQRICDKQQSGTQSFAQYNEPCEHLCTDGTHFHAPVNFVLLPLWQDKTPVDFKIVLWCVNRKSYSDTDVMNRI